MSFRVYSLTQLFAVLLFEAGTLFAAFPVLSHIEHRHAINEQRWENSDSIRICAIRVEFQPDNLTGTSGSGLMSDSTIFPDSLVIDGLPHDNDYFADHLDFVRNYFRTVSHERLSFANQDIWPVEPAPALRLNYPMWHYNFNTTQELLNEKLVELFVHSIWKADSAGIPLQDYNAFVIFHAGIGKDFSIGFDNTPFDIPSAYISTEDLIPYRASLPTAVTRGIILPEGENQVETLEFGIELSLNGIAVKLFGNWLGLPDLFDTQTGLSGIGRWGMMDQGSGNINALVPALPDAWSRVYMNWIEPQVIYPGGDTAIANTTYQVSRFGVADAPEVIKIPVTPREYYLIENRDADADSLGTVTLFDRDGRQMRIDRFADRVTYDSGFLSAVRASHYDFGIPGSGILIWHIDEDVIEANLETNSVNADIDHRGVDLVEADGPQDIGREFGFASAGSGTELGIQEDAWWSGNRDHRDANNSVIIRFTDRSHPSAKLYDGASTFLEISNFSDIGATMSLRIRMTHSLPGFPVEFSGVVEWRHADISGDGQRELYFLTPDSLVRVTESGERQNVGRVPTGVHFSPNTDPVDIDADGAEDLLFSGIDSTGYLTRAESGEDSLLLGNYGFSDVTYLWPARTTSGNGRIMRVGCDLPDCTDEEFEVTIGRFKNTSETQRETFLFSEGIAPLSVYNVEPLPSSVFLFCRAGDAACIEIQDSMLVTRWWIVDRQIRGEATVLRYPDRAVIYLDGYGYVSSNTGSLLCSPADCYPPQIDWNNDGVASGGGEFADIPDVRDEDFPRFDQKSYHRFLDLDASGDPDIIVLNTLKDTSQSSQSPLASRITVILHNGRKADDFPVATIGAHLDGTALSFDSTNTLYFVSQYEQDGHSFFSLNRLPIVTSNRDRFPYTESNAIINIGPLRPQVNEREDWVYCWPNPANSVSHIRVTRSAASSATVAIYDLAGRKLAVLSGSSSIGGPYEMLWDVSNVESGIYVGRVEVSGGGTTESQEIKIAVVR